MASRTLLQGIKSEGESIAEDISNALEILKQAMKMEREGRAFYLKAAQATQDKRGQEIFLTLADDEKAHLALLARQYNTLRGRKRWLDLPEVKRTPIGLDKSIFPKDREAFAEVVTGKSDDLDALRYGLDIETKSYDLYRRAALETGNSMGKAMFRFLSGEELVHFDILMMRYEYLAGPVGWQA